MGELLLVLGMRMKHVSDLKLRIETGEELCVD